MSRTLKIEYENKGTKKKVELKRIIRQNLTDFQEEYQNLLNIYCEHELSLGSMIAEEENWELLKNICRWIPTTKDETLQIEEFEDDYDLIDNLFFFKTDENKQQIPGDLIEFNCLNLKKMTTVALEKLTKMMKKEELEKK